MTTSMSACGKANVFGSLRGAVHVSGQHHTAARPYSGNGKFADRSEDRAAQRELLVNVLGANATKRDAKQYLARFQSPAKSSKDQFRRALQESINANNREAQTRLDRSGINLGSLYAPARAIAESPQFVHEQLEVNRNDATPESPLHIALVCLRAPENVGDGTLDGLAVTLSQLVKLDMQIVLVLDCQKPRSEFNEEAGRQARELRNAFVEQSDRLRKALGRHNPNGGRSILGAMEFTDAGHTPNQQLSIAVPNLLLDPMKRGIVTMIPTLAYTTSGQLKTVNTEEVMVALLKKFSVAEVGGDTVSDVNCAVDRVIILDRLGGIPSKARGDDAHVFVNLEQEYDDIREELSEYSSMHQQSSHEDPRYRQHQSNLDITRQCLTLLPPSSSALIISPEETASAYIDPRQANIGIGTRRQRNTLIHNLLTNKPMVSSSLPVARLNSPANGDKTPHSITPPTATLVRRGMPLTIIPAVSKGRGWLTPPDGRTSLRLEADARVDFTRLLHLIESSFRRKLDVQAYLDRIRGRVAGIIVSGEYEGGAILTWEMPAGAGPDPSRLVPYLDKFAVHPSSQGSSGVADIVFQSMLRTCFPHGVCWRSRKSNPANKWYFERAVGSWQIPESNWTMFWTGEGVVVGQQRWEDYVNVCRNIGPTWAD